MVAHSRVFVAGLAVWCLACTKTEHPQVITSESASSTALDSQPSVPAPHLAGPRMSTDSVARAPFFEIEAGELVLHIPPNMAGVINDSLPGFTLVQRAAYEPSLVQFADDQAKESREIGESANDSLARYALSAAIGDFDGDSASDVAIMGNSRDSTATLFVLAESLSRPQPRIIFITRPRPANHSDREWRYLNTVRAGPVRVFDEDGKSPPYQIKTDGVQVAYWEKGAQVFFLEKGVVQSIITSD